MTERLRNHPSLIIRTALPGIILGGLLNFTLGAELGPTAGILALCIIGLFALYGALVWSRTWLTMEDDHAVWECDLVSRRRVVIPYAKVASANVVRGLVDILFDTCSVRVNVNSSVNSARADVSLTLERDVAERVRTILTTGMFGEVPAEEPVDEDVVAEEIPEGETESFTFSDALVYGLLGAGTGASLLSAGLVIYSILSVVLTGSVGLVPVLMLMFTTGMPLVAGTVRYCDFTVTRTGDRLRVRHGMARTYDTEFEARRINALRVRSPLLMRVLGLCIVEAEVVGINAVENNVTPVIGPVVRTRDLDSFLERFVPELHVDVGTERSPAEARVPVAMRTLLTMVPCILVLALAHLGLSMLDPMDDIDAKVIRWCILGADVLLALVPILLAVHAVAFLRTCRFGIGEEVFRAVNGPIDRETVTMRYDRVQISATVASPSARRHGVARAKVEFLSSAGHRCLETGYFRREELERVQERMMERIESGEYDYRDMEI